MSVSVIRPQTSGGLYKVQSKVILKSPKPSHAAAKIKRNLFGCVDQEENKRFVAQELLKLQRQATEKWGFDFQNEKPLKKSRFEWISTAPQPYVLTHTAHAKNSQLNDESTNSGDNSDIENPNYLLDERAERAYNYHKEPTTKFIDCDTTTASPRTSLIRPTAFKPITTEITTRSKPSRRMSTPSPKQKQPEKRQPKITDFLPEKKKSLTTSSSAKKLSSHNNNNNSKSFSQYMTRRSCGSNTSSSTTSKSLSQ